MDESDSWTIVVDAAEWEQIKPRAREVRRHRA